MPEEPYYVVIFTSLRRDAPGDGYAAMATRMEVLAREQPGFLGIESARDPDGLGITVSYWATLEAVAAWRANAEHTVAQKLGRDEWYRWFAIRICRVERATEFTRPGEQ
jgi:heme-degrading monooxygenase HmoA